MLTRLLKRYWKLHVVFIAIAAIVSGEVVLAYTSTLNNQATDAAVESTQRVVLIANEALASLLDMETGYRGFLITGQDEFLEPYVAGSERYRAQLLLLQQLTAQSPIQSERWRAIEQLAETWQQKVTRPTIDRRRAIPPGQTDLDGILSTVASGEGKRRMDQMRAVFAEALASEQDLLARRSREQTEADARLLLVLVLGTFGAAVLSLVLGGGVLMYLERERLAGVRLAIQTTEHELYNQLTTASGNVQLLQRESDLTAQHHVWAERACGGIDRSLTIIRGMRDLPELRETVWSKGTLKTIDLRSPAKRPPAS